MRLKTTVFVISPNIGVAVEPIAIEQDGDPEYGDQPQVTFKLRQNLFPVTRDSVDSPWRATTFHHILKDQEAIDSR